MNSAAPWTFGLNHLLTIVGFVITIAIASFEFRTFDRWRREKIEENRIEIAFEALAIAYESRFVFQDIRARLRKSYEWQDMPDLGETPRRREHMGGYYAVLKRIEHHRDFFDRVRSLQPKFMVAFGSETESIFDKLHTARQTVEIACEELMSDFAELDPEDQEGREFRAQLRADTAASRNEPPTGRNRVGNMVEEFRAGIEERCQPFLKAKFNRRQFPKPRWLVPKLFVNKK